AAAPWALGVNVLPAWLGHSARTVSRSGAITGAIVGIAIYCGGGGRAWILLFAAFLAASIASRLGLKRKSLLGIAEERGGRRGAGNAIANCGVAVIAAIAAMATPYSQMALVALAAALIAGGSDTVASESGKAWGRSTFLVTTFGRVKPGTPGAMSVEGTAAGVVAALGLAAPAVARALMAAVFNAGNNALNQIYDLDIDRVNKPKRPLPSGRLRISQVWWFTNITYALALVLAWFVTPRKPALTLSKGHECFWLVLVAVVCTYIYSVPPMRTKRLGIWANVTIALPRGVRLKVA